MRVTHRASATQGECHTGRVTHRASDTQGECQPSTSNDLWKAIFIVRSLSASVVSSSIFMTSSKRFACPRVVIGACEQARADQSKQHVPPKRQGHLVGMTGDMAPSVATRAPCMCPSWPHVTDADAPDARRQSCRGRMARHTMSRPHRAAAHFTWCGSNVVDVESSGCCRDRKFGIPEFLHADERRIGHQELAVVHRPHLQISGSEAVKSHQYCVTATHCYRSTSTVTISGLRGWGKALAAHVHIRNTRGEANTR